MEEGERHLEFAVLYQIALNLQLGLQGTGTTGLRNNSAHDVCLE